jgi:hypothetical protein
VITTYDTKNFVSMLSALPELRSWCNDSDQDVQVDVTRVGALWDPICQIFLWILVQVLFINESYENQNLGNYLAFKKMLFTRTCIGTHDHLQLFCDFLLYRFVLNANPFRNIHHFTIIMLQLHTYSENISIFIFREYTYLWELQTLLPVKCCIYTPLYNSKHAR